MHRRAFPAAVLASIALCIAFSSWTGRRFGGTFATILVDDLFMTLTPVIAGAACWWRASSRGYSRRQRRFWALWGSSYLAFAAGMFWWDYEQLLRDVVVPYPSWGDVGFLGAMVINGIALLYSPQAADRPAVRVRGLLDGLIVASAVFFSVWQVVLERIANAANTSTLAKGIGIAYATGYLAVLTAILLQTAASRGRSTWGFRALAASLTLLTAVNFPYAILCIDGTYYTGHPIDVMWIAAFFLGTLAAVVPELDHARVRDDAPKPWTVLFQVALPSVPVFIAGAFAFWMMLTGQRFTGVSAWTIGAMVMLVLCRHYLALVDVRRRTDELVGANLRIVEADRAKNQFLAAMSHELRTPLNSILGFSEILITRMASQLGEKPMRFVKNINTSGTHLLRLIDDILDLAKIESGKMGLVAETIDPRSFCDGVLAVVRGMATPRQVKLVLEAFDGLPTFEADPVRIKQVLYNLLSNAVKFSPVGGTVTLCVRAIAPSEPPLHVPAIEFRVCDQGIGIAPEHHALIFEEFRQVEDAGQEPRGTGLGLALVRRLVALHGGAVTLHSRLGHGATFVVTLPRRRTRATRT
jgi:signal transduction histidine kinase